MSSERGCVACPRPHSKDTNKLRGLLLTPTLSFLPASPLPSLPFSALAMWPKLPLNLQSPCLSPSSARIIGVCHHTYSLLPPIWFHTENSLANKSRNGIRSINFRPATITHYWGTSVMWARHLTSQLPLRPVHSVTPSLGWTNSSLKITWGQSWCWKAALLIPEPVCLAWLSSVEFWAPWLCVCGVWSPLGWVVRSETFSLIIVTLLIIVTESSDCDSGVPWEWREQGEQEFPETWGLGTIPEGQIRFRWWEMKE
jgi:hypothetical protein